MKTSIIGLPATYSTQPDALTQLYIVRCEDRILGLADSLRDAKCAAQLHYSLIGSMQIH